MSQISHEEYLHARCDLEEEIRKFVEITRSNGYSETYIARYIVDIAHDIDIELVKGMQEYCLPFVAKFHGSKALDFETVSKDWQKISDQWDKDRMWEKISQ